MNEVEFDLQIIEVKQRQSASGDIVGRLVIEFRPFQKNTAVLAKPTGMQLLEQELHCWMGEKAKTNEIN